MTCYEVFMILLEAAGLIVAIGTLIITFLNFLDKRDTKRK